MKRAITTGLFLFPFLFLLTGCWSRHELNDISIVVGLGIDKAGESYKITIQTVNPGQVTVKKGGSSNATSVITYEETGMTVPEALSRMSVKAPRYLHYSHLRMVVFGEDMARAGISKPLDFLSRNMDMRTDFYFIVAKQAKASEVLKVLSAMDPIPANNMYTKLETSDKYWSATGSMNLNYLLQELATHGKSPTMTGVEILGNRKIGEKTSNAQYVDPPALLNYSGMAAFKFDRFVGWLNENDTKALNYVQNSVYQTTGYIPCPGAEGNITMQVIRSNTVIHPHLVSGLPEFDVNVRIDQDISDVECKIDLSQAAVVAELKQLSDSKLETLIGESIAKIQKKLGADIYGFGVAFHHKYPKSWHQIKNWNEVFRTIKVRVHVDSTLRRVGTILQPINQITTE
ncbi:Ger(x)C family spore germination protein [Paenibacillus alginolyticus]|uniref:Ger(x)C family spore germination protein n=1 Tax=Paenibacillus alginolyticus TaxID=59839 RepID=UPI00041C8C80|nr:Ger(x)C family spore germination protein [Paenibacillus alginolyticus]MCY9669165.1 Ger(x)C family spore germination protein [Paenibacillus alginolyticus]